MFEKLIAARLYVKRIQLTNNSRIGDECMKLLGEYIKVNKNIEVVWLEWNALSDAGIRILASYVDGSTKLKQLSLSGNSGITDKSIPLLLKMVELAGIESIELASTSVEDKESFIVPMLCNRLKSGSSELSYPNFTDFVGK